MTVLPNVHAVYPPADPAMAMPNSMVFVGGFQHEPNVDAMLYFCGEVMPLIKKQIPNARLSIVGSNPPAAIQALASESIDVTGYVPDTTPYLEKSSVSIAPLRYGAGMKGKIGEAMSHGLPVVTTSVGAEGFGMTPGEHILVGDSAAEFAEHVIRLMQDQTLHERIRLAGWEFIRSRYSVDAVASLCQVAIQEILKRLRFTARELYAKHVAWRL
jgi:glycosyltransferase involved in cell wall biosynthesis